MRLLPEDYEFLTWVKNEINGEASISLELQDQTILRTIARTATWYYEWALDSTQSEWFMLLGSDINAARSVDGMSARVQLPEYVQSINNYVVGGGSSFNSASTDALRIPILNAYGGTFQTSTRFGVGTTSQETITDFTIAMYKVAAVNMYNKRGITTTYNNLSHMLNINGQLSDNLFLDIERRLPIQNLYNSYQFQNLIIAHCMKKLSRLIGMYRFKLPGDVELNIETLEADGAEMVDKMEEEIKGQNNFTRLFKQ